MNNKYLLASTLCGFIAVATTMGCTAPTIVHGTDASNGRTSAAGTGALTKVGDGANGVDFTRVANSGALIVAVASPLGADPNDWGCTYDNKTGLTWEVKTLSGLRAMSHTYTSYDSNAATNGGGVGTASGGSCATTGRCDTEKFVQDVNAAGMCGHIDWRMPSVHELNKLVRLGVSPTIDNAYFPNTVSGYYWSGSPVISVSTHAWSISFDSGSSVIGVPCVRDGSYSVRLVRGEE